jgi:hypothetical protein
MMTPLNDMYGAYTFIESGNVPTAQLRGLVQLLHQTLSLSAQALLSWVQFARPSEYQAGNGLSLNGTVFNVNVDNNTTAITGANVVVKAGANLVTPNIGNAVGNSLSLVGTGNISGGNLSITGLATVGANLTSGNLTTGSIIANGNISGNNLTLSGTMTANGTATAGNLITAGDLLVNGNSTIDGLVSVLTELYVGPTANAAIVTGPVIFAEGASNSFSQIGLQSTNGNSSADMIVYSNDGSDSDGFADMGVTGNTFNDTNYTVTAPNDGYMYLSKVLLVQVVTWSLLLVMWATHTTSYSLQVASWLPMRSFVWLTLLLHYNPRPTQVLTWVATQNILVTCTLVQQPSLATSLPLAISPATTSLVTAHY